jgi:hypothetical protein
MSCCILYLILCGTLADGRALPTTKMADGSVLRSQFLFPAHLGQWDLHDLFKRIVVALARLSLEPGVGADSVTSTPVEDKTPRMFAKFWPPFAVTLQTVSQRESVMLVWSG